MAQHSFAQPRAQSCTTWARRPRRDGGHVGVLLWVCRAVRPRCGTGTTKHDITPTILGGGQAPPRCSRTMPKATKAGRQMARFDEGELWCADDAVPPVSPAGWYFRPGGGSPLVWIGPFPTAEAAKVAPCGSDPFTAARRQLDAWVRAREEARSESPAEAEVAVDGSIDARRIPLRL